MSMFRTGGVLLFLAALLSISVACGGGSDEGGGGEQGLQTIRVGYLHTPAVDSHMWLGMEKGYFEEEGLKVDATEFDTGISLSQALTGGSLDVAVMGAVISNFPAQGQGEVFLVNDVEEGTAQLWTAGDSSIDSVQDLAG